MGISALVLFGIWEQNPRISIPYELFAGYIHSDTLKWSYATTLGNEADVWNKGISELSTSDMVKTLKEEGFQEYISIEKVMSQQTWRNLRKSWKCFAAAVQQLAMTVL